MNIDYVVPDIHAKVWIQAFRLLVPKFYSIFHHFMYFPGFFLFQAFFMKIHWYAEVNTLPIFSSLFYTVYNKIDQACCYLGINIESEKSSLRLIKVEKIIILYQSLVGVLNCKISNIVDNLLVLCLSGKIDHTQNYTR